MVHAKILNANLVSVFLLSNIGGLIQQQDLTTEESRGVNSDFPNNLERSSTLQLSANLMSFNNGFYSTGKRQEEPSFCSSVTFMVGEEDWDNDIVNHDYALDHNAKIQNGDTEPSDNQTYLLEKNFDVPVNKDLFCEETSSTYSSDSDACVENPSQNQQTSYQKTSLHLVSEREWLDELESLYFSDMITELKLLLLRAFEASKNCFDFVLFVVKFADFDIQTGKKSLAYLTLVEFEAWLKSKTEGRSIEEVQLLGYWPTDNHKDMALDVVVSSTFLVFEPIKRTFQLDSGENGFLTKHVRFLMHSKRKYKEVS